MNWGKLLSMGIRGRAQQWLERRGLAASPGEFAGDFLPDLCSASAVFALVLVAELLALVLVLADSSLQQFDWGQLALTSILVQWVVLLSAALLCPLRGYLGRCPPLLAGSLSYGLVLAVTGVFSALGQWFLLAAPALDLWQLAENLAVAAVFAGIALRYLYLQQQLSWQQRAELQSRIQALQSRIRPHFLFNSMNSIASLIESDPATAERVVEDLSDLFRSSLAEPALVSVSDELAVARRYIGIEQLRLGERLRLDWQLGDYPPEARVPSLLLQPLLENAIYHGIQPISEGGTVEVRIVENDRRLELSVRNPVAPPSAAGQRRGNSMALNNIRHRLAAHFGKAGQLSTECANGEFTARIVVPVMETVPE